MKEYYHNHPNAIWHESNSDSSAPKRILVAFVLNTVFAIIEIIGGILTGSVAIIADAVHDLGDSVSLGVAWYFERVARTHEKDHVFSYGYGRFSLLSAVISGVVIISGMIYILIESFSRFSYHHEPYAPGMIFLALLGILVNGAGAFYLSHGETQNEKVLTWHLLEDVLGWVAVLVGAMLMLIFGWQWIDTLLAVIIAVYIGYNAIKVLMTTSKLMLQSVPEGFDVDKFISDAEKIEGVVKAHDLHVWSMDGKKHILSVHVVIARKDIDLANRVRDAMRKVASQFGEFHMTIEVENPVGAEV